MDLSTDLFDTVAPLCYEEPVMNHSFVGNKWTRREVIGYLNVADDVEALKRNRETDHRGLFKLPINRTNILVECNFLSLLADRCPINNHMYKNN